MRVNASRGLGRLVVTADGTGIEGRAGAALLSRVADRVGLAVALRKAVDGCRGWRDHPPGRVVVDLAVVLADGGRCIDDIETLRRRHTAVFGHVASEPTAWRTIEALADDELVDIASGAPWPPHAPRRGRPVPRHPTGMTHRCRPRSTSTPPW